MAGRSLTLPQSTPIKARILGTGAYLPDNVVTNVDLAKVMDTSDEWIQQRSGIRERRYTPEGITPSDMGERAARLALDAAGVPTSAIDCVVVTTLSSEHCFPGTAAFLQRRLKIGTTPAFEVRAQCSGFIYGLTVANALIVSGTYKTVLLCAVELQSRGLNHSTSGRDVAVLFGDGAGAAVLCASRGDDTRSGIIASEIHTEGEHAERLWMEYPNLASGKAMCPDAIAAGRGYPTMDGRHVFKHAVVRMPEVVTSLLATTGIPLHEVDHFLFHQANMRINEVVAAALEIAPDRCLNHIDRYGNCSSASIPILLHEGVASGRIKPGELVCCAAFGSGFTWGAALLRA